MKTLNAKTRKMIAVAAAYALLSACAGSPVSPEGAAGTRNKLTRLQSDPQLSSRAPVAIKEAEDAVTAAEKPEKDTDIANHRVFMADRKVDIAWAQGQSRLLEDERKNISEQRETARLDSRTLEADAANAKASDLQRQIAELNAKPTDRGLVVTLGDVLFATGKSDIKSAAAGHLDKLANFLNTNQERTVVIEGHTDNVGSDDSNAALSQRRADSVKSYLITHGVGSARVTTTGMGESSPVANNTSSSGRQQNRRVEVIIENGVISSR